MTLVDRSLSGLWLFMYFVMVVRFRMFNLHQTLETNAVKNL